uniref:Small ribosomal subunit protein mS40 n=1 Tax=Amblyomma aureolatum TaxID=187763 RepID=A0A1E1X9E0_9ACAR
MWRACLWRNLRAACTPLPRYLQSVEKKALLLETPKLQEVSSIPSLSWFQGCKKLSTSARSFCKEEEEVETEGVAEGGEETDGDGKLNVKKVILHPPELSIQYLESKAYKETYGDYPVWTMYRRNFKGQFPPRKTRRNCIKQGMIATGNPCPLCRDEYLVVHHTNTKLLTQFISPHTGKTLKPYKTGLCRRKQFELDLAILKAKDLGLIKYQVPFRHYDYKDYYPQLKEPTEERVASVPE